MVSKKQRKPYSFLREIDIYGVPFKTYFHRHDSITDRTTHISQYKSYLSGCVSVFLISMMTIYATMLLSSMYSGEQDNVKKLVVSNPMNKDSNRRAYMSDHVFMPYIEIIHQDYEKYDLYENNS